MISQLTRKSVQMGLKKGWNFGDFEVKFECSEEEIRERIQSLYNHGEADGFIKEIERNAGKKGGQKPKPKKRYTEEPAAIVVVVDPELTEKELPTEGRSVYVPSLEELQSTESELSAELMALETKHASLKGERKDIAKAIRGIEDSISKQLEQSSALVATANAKGEEMNNLSSTIAEKRAVLEEVRLQISEQKHITLCVYLDGTISPYDEGRVFNLDDSGYESLFLSLAQDDECSNLKIAEVKTLARLITGIRNASDLTFEVICENQELERVYKAVIAKYA